MINNQISITNEELLNDLTNLELLVIEIIYYNPRKQRYILKVKKEKTMFILKWNDLDKTESLNMLQNEIKQYENNTYCNYSPKLIYSNENLILLEYIEGITLREWIINYRKEQKSIEEFRIIIDELIQILMSMYKRKDNKFISPSTFISTLQSYYRSVFFSSPMSAKRNKIENTLLRINNKLLRKKINKSFKLLEEKLNSEHIKLNCYPIHSDFHLNNIIVENHEENILIIDWENIKESSFLIDVVYLYVFIHNLLDGLKSEQTYLNKQFEQVIDFYQPELNEIFRDTSEIFLIGISTNRLFGYHAKAYDFLKGIFDIHRRLHYFNKVE